ncbi:uncharacterized protein LOC127718971 [Mytilus californianus]|uniref:uncharacterized protein LOC127718971 n=1 Tax=Mytilus californianus TaxID=6549 RepID=UPI0022469E69|nr:uncharacterized protein LOC127718971 [Mytilus californianus]
MNSVRDILSNDSATSTITSGSFGEGLSMRGSDLDVMFVRKDIEVYENVIPNLRPNISYFSLERDNVKAGFTRLQLAYTIWKNILNQCEEQHGKYYYSSTLYKQHFLQLKGSTIHGPCLTDADGTYDFAWCLHCKTWVSPAVKWVSRSNNSWPSDDVKLSIIKHGVLFVPIGVKGSPNEDLEWRVSFSVGEKLLINTFTHTQLLCYALLKIILKDLIDTSFGCKDLLCSYFMKTIVFWLSEELQQSAWKPANFISCFIRCFNRLIYCVETSNCLNYFIPENNMFENKIQGRAREILLEKLYTLHSYGWRCILFSDQVSKFDVSMWNLPIESHALYVNDVEKMLKSNVLSSAMNTIDLPESNRFNIGMIHPISYTQSLIKNVYTYYFSQLCKRLAQDTPLFSSFSCNKFKYKQYKSCLSTLLKNIYHDAVSGWLMVASLFYKTKQYNKALHIIMYSMSKCTPEKLHRFMTMSDIHYQLLKLQTFHQKSFVCLQKTMFVDCMQFTKDSTIIPDELQINHKNGRMIFPSTVFAYFLNCLCHYHLNNVRQCQDSLQGLEMTTDEEDYFIAEAYNMLGIVLNLIGDRESARQAFLKSVEIQPDESINSAGKRLLFMS